MAISASMVKDLREKTGAGMMDCKKALTEANGDMDRAIDILREKGQATAAKKAGRIAAEGIVAVVIAEDGKSGAIAEVNSETDFVANNPDFQKFASDVAAQALKTTAVDVEAFLDEAWILDTSKTVKEALVEKIAIIGENLSIRRFAKVEATGVVKSYTHMGGKIGVIVAVDSDVVNASIEEIGKNVAMQISAMSPICVSSKDLASDYVEKETEIIKAQIDNDETLKSKPANILAGMVQGRLKKQLKEVCLLDQDYIRAENKESVGQYVDMTAKAAGANAAIAKFVRFEAGEGIEKKSEDFAAEVAKQMNK